MLFKLQLYHYFKLLMFAGYKFISSYWIKQIYHNASINVFRMFLDLFIFSFQKGKMYIIHFISKR